MKGLIYVDQDLLGEVDFKIIDESMGAIGGNLIPHMTYEKYRIQIQKPFEQNGIAQ